jgi:nucleotide-binding universal stress UspA family protein
MRKRLLCVADLGVKTDDLMARTALLARQMQAQVKFVHAVSDEFSGRVMRMKVNRAHTRLLSLAERAMKHAPSDVSVGVRVGKPLAIITEAAEAWNPDLIVMSAPRRTRLDYLLGTTAERVIRATKRSVLVVSQPVKGAYSKLVLASDRTWTARHVASTALSLGVLDNVRAWVVHGFMPPYEGMITRDALDEEQHARNQLRIRERMHRELIEDLVAVGVDMRNVKVRAEPASPFRVIRSTLETTSAELLVIGTSRWFALKRLLFGSVADAVFRSVECDVLAVAPAVAEEQKAAA